MNVAQALAAAMVLGLDRLDAQLLLLHALGRPGHDRAWLLAHDADLLDASIQASFDAGVRRRAAGEPLAYITGHKEFYGLDLAVDARVLVPRPDTETLVEWALDVLKDVSHPSVLDLGTGSGAIALALKKMRPDARVSAVDASSGALHVARSNALRLGLDVDFLQGSWLEPVHGQFKLIVSNPPYIAALDRHLKDLAHEPMRALASGADGLDDIRQIIAQAREHIHPGGWLLLEHGYDQAGAVRSLLLATGFEDVQSKRDIHGIERCSGGQNPTDLRR
jgi:release factor glutamine methyltransferase